MTVKVIGKRHFTRPPWNETSCGFAEDVTLTGEFPTCARPAVYGLQSSLSPNATFLACVEHGALARTKPWLAQMWTL